MTDPITYKLDDTDFCHPQCPHLANADKPCQGYCTLIMRELMYYDWHLACCKSLTHVPRVQGDGLSIEGA